ncbi:MAG: hypothetical protein HFE78_01360 [Clostridiales bacterium]|nr:hypothetical protein [Clostridiales bacterium]
MSKIDKKVKDFIRKYNLHKEPLTREKMMRIIESQGFKVISFSRRNMQSLCQQLVGVLRLREMADSRDAFTYVDQEHKIVFLLEGLSDDTAITFLLHEEAHIFLKHLQGEPAVDMACALFIDSDKDIDVVCETEANCFVMQVKRYLHQSKVSRISIRVAQYVIPIVLLAALCMFVVQKNGHDDLPVSIGIEEGAAACYWTDGGEVYHLYKDCTHIIRSIKIYSGTPQESMKERCCLDCQYRQMKEKGRFS